MKGQTNYVLVHGAYHGGWCWRRVADRLRATGGVVYTPTLTGVGDRFHLAGPDIDLSCHIRDVTNLILWEDATDIVLCGHSYGGMVISGVAEILTDRIHALVYLDALKPEPQTCLWDYLPAAHREAMKRITSNGLISPTPAAAFQVNEQDRAWVDSKCTPQPHNTFHERLPSTNHRVAIRNNVYVYASGYALPMFQRFADEAGQAANWQRVDLPYGHDLMIDAPDEVADILIRTAWAGSGER